MEDKPDILSRVKKTTPPPYLYTRIMQRVQQAQEAPVSVTFKFAFTAIAVIILLLNVWVFVKSSHTAPEPVKMETPSYSSTINNIYYE